MKALQFIKDRLYERTTWDGVILIIAGIAFLVLKPIANLIALFAIGYGAWTIYKKEDQ